MNRDPRATPMSAHFLSYRNAPTLGQVMISDVASDIAITVGSLKTYSGKLISSEYSTMAIRKMKFIIYFGKSRNVQAHLQPSRRQ